MADDTHALSPLNARAAQPSDADYEAILNAFLETSRGRWFLGEYARRNRNADTHMVLAAVERIEAAFAVQTQPRTQIAALPAIIDAVAVTEAAIGEATRRPADREPLELIQRGANAIRNISWTLRECGADPRICDLIDVQVKAIGDGCERVEADADSAAVPDRVRSAFDDLTHTIERLAAGVPEPPPVSSNTDLAGFVDRAVAASAEDGSVVELDDAAYEALVHATSAAIIGGPQDAARPAFHVQEGLDDIEIVDDAESPARATAAAGDMPHPDGSAQAAPAPSPTSLGHALLASGVVRHPGATPEDPLAPFRRMSQAEKIAFFS